MPLPGARVEESFAGFFEFLLAIAIALLAGGNEASEERKDRYRPVEAPQTKPWIEKTNEPTI